eukprot:scaffold46643_cov41-Phaeocystis_antarctica.AAC.1
MPQLRFWARRPEARRFGYGYIDTGYRQRAKSGGVRRLSGRVRWRGTPRRVACGPGATTTLEPTFAFKRAVYDA